RGRLSGFDGDSFSFVFVPLWKIRIVKSIVIHWLHGEDKIISRDHAGDLKSSLSIGLSNGLIAWNAPAFLVFRNDRNHCANSRITAAGRNCAGDGNDVTRNDDFAVFDFLRSRDLERL